MNDFFFKETGIAYRKNSFESHRLTLVFIHGLAGSASAWFPYESLFGKQYNIVTLDLRGHGMSDKPKQYSDYDLSSLAKDLYELLNYLNIDKCVLISHSFGTLVALEFMQNHQKKVSANIFLSPTAFISQRKTSALGAIASSVLSILFAILSFHSQKRGRVDYSYFKNTGDWNLFRMYRDILITTPRVYFYYLRHAYSKKYNHLWRKIQVPTLIMHGTKDSIVPVQYAKQLAQEISGSKLILLEGANHVIVLNDIQDIFISIQTFILTNNIDS